jgi:hypothetical protein
MLNLLQMPNAATGMIEPDNECEYKVKDVFVRFNLASAKDFPNVLNHSLLRHIRANNK